MNKYSLGKCVLALALLLTFAKTDAMAQSNSVGDCKNIVSINSIPGGGVLYKSENIHGGRGPTFLVQNVAERTNKKVIEIRDARCQLVGAFGLYATDYPYGSRYYSRTGGTGFDPGDLEALLKRVGSTNFLVEGVNKWIRVRNPFNRDGSVNK